MILVVGSRGMLGHDLMAHYGDAARGVDIGDIDITDPLSVREVLTTIRPGVVINAAAYTDVDGCETNRETAMAVNAEGPAHLAMVTREIGALLVHLSTDYVFDGTRTSPWTEDDPCSPLSVYGESKLAGEMNVRINPDHLIVRTQWLYGLHGRNFVETMLRLSDEREEISVVADQTGSPTWTVDLVRAIDALVKGGCRGTYHAAARGSCSWNQFAREIFRLAGKKTLVIPITTDQLARPARRPLNSTLDCGKLQRDTGFTFPHWSVSLERYLVLRDRRG